MRRSFHVMAILAVIAAGLTNAARAQQKAAAPVKKIAVRAGHLIDGKNDKVIDNALILLMATP
jgi:hypothetical protein